jgi:hypothetical protein
MTTSQSLYTALTNDDILLLTPGSYADYGFSNLTDENTFRLFGAYHSILKFIGKDRFINEMHEAFINEKLHDVVNELTDTIPIMFRNHWFNFVNNGGIIAPFYI